MNSACLTRCCPRAPSPGLIRAPTASPRLLRPLALAGSSRYFSASTLRSKHHDGDPRFRDLGKQISDEFAVVREHYETPRHPIVLAHGLMGFAELRLGSYVPPIHYWRGISESLRTLSGPSNIITTSVPPSGSIEERAAKLSADIAAKAGGRAVNIVAHSMGGLDARYMISHLKPANVKVMSLVTVATPHRGSAFADFLLDGRGPIRLANLYGLIERAGLGTQAFEQLTQKYMAEEFNPRTPDSDEVRYFSYGACTDRPPLLSPFRQSHRILEEAEGANDGLVSVASSRWGDYKGTLLDVSHLDLINWSNRLKWTLRKVWMGQTRTFNAVAFYLDIADMLAKEGL
ncbi:triacylglycerol lipase [Colletotrichum graminicola]|uniref:Triacylglycerol lipase n=1 Tax=Colletotrichum graminicola (strain M1.001 / M2 / FGSC 10212) TaxID=645133 RepID=E3QBK4_COLGM|nr:triacylglycerol lipase [Colletotrichum graminicola M1.001]EFQ28343.1 triacylglycerol lipase [Colletotrichum graminicola M1.001]WDK20704.1 triacylglycerol lipase [Colletotrichum graminicola]